MATDFATSVNAALSALAVKAQASYGTGTHAISMPGGEPLAGTSEPPFAMLTFAGPMRFPPSDSLKSKKLIGEVNIWGVFAKTANTRDDQSVLTKLLTLVDALNADFRISDTCTNSEVTEFDIPEGGENPFPGEIGSGAVAGYVRVQVEIVEI